VLEGEVKRLIDGKELVLGAGGMILSNRFTTIAYEELQAGTHIVGFYFKPEYFTESLLNQLAEEPLVYRFLIESLKSEDTIGRYYVFEFSTLDDVHFYSMLLLKQVVKMRYKDNKVTRAAFLLLIVEVSQLAEKSLRLNDSFVSSTILVSEMLNVMENNLKNITLEKLARQFNFHPNYLSSLIKKETGKSFKEHLLTMRLETAAYYLRNTKLPIQKISEEIGYQDRAFFFRIFKKYYEKTPGQYRSKFQSIQIFDSKENN
jgi:YesN/AraC family two-component response regulator